MKIVILNECFFKEKHRASLKQLGEVIEYHDTNSEELVIERLNDADIAIADCYLSPLNQKVLSSLKSIKYITLNSTGYDLVDVDAAKTNNIKVSNISGFSTDGVAEQTFALMFAVNRHLIELHNNVKIKPYEIDPSDPTQNKYIGVNLRGKTLGLIGLGKIGQRVAEIANAIGMNVIAYNRTQKSIPYIQQLSLQEVLKNCDFLSIHTPLNKDTENLLSGKELELLKPTAIVVNTARGKIIDERALYKALKEKRIRGAGLDTITDWSKKNPLLSLDNVLITPHSAWYTEETFENLADKVVSNIQAFIKGEPINLII